MREHETKYSVRTMSRVLSVSESGYYRWRDAGPGKRAMQRAELEAAVKAVFEGTRERYGSPRVHRELRAAGKRCTVHHIADIMREAGLRAKARKKYRATTDSKHRHPIAPNLVPQRVRPIAQNLIWVTDITFVHTEEGWLYLCVVLDLFSRRVVGWSMGSRITSELAEAALLMAIRSRRPAPGLLIHSDRGSQFARGGPPRALGQFGLVQSMSRKANCWDNAVIESFFHSLKVELVHGERYQTREEARASIFEYIEVFYNRERWHSANCGATPEAFELRRVA